MKKFVYNFPKILAIVVIIVFIIYLFDLSRQGAGYYFTVIAAIPLILALAATITSYKNRIYGGVMFLIISASFFYHTSENFPNYNYFILPVFLAITGILFITIKDHKYSQSYLEN